ncbi:MAG: DHHA1 domain-containing protein [Vicinamibacterales bacterium]
MTTRLYYTEPYRTEFDATVTAVDVVDGRPCVTLDQTAFYPTSGGQPFDTGTLGGAAVSDVIDREDGTIAHVTAASLRVGEVVQGVVDWARRFDHMQQHTGQHVLSAAFDRLFGVRTESFHMGTVSATIDLAREVSAIEVAKAEDEANRIVWEDRPVAIRFATAEEAAAMPLRKEPARTGALRLIEVEDFDLSACGGTHVARTGAIGVIAIGGWEKFRGGSRVEFLCGGRALTRFRMWRDSLAATQKFLSVAPEEMAAAVERMQADSKARQRTLRGFQEKLATHEAHALLEKATRAGEHLVLIETLDGWDAQGLKAIAVAAAAAQPNAVVALFSAATPALVVIARGSAATADAGALLKGLVAEFGGKGGGKPDLAQGGGLAGSAVQLKSAISTLLGVPAV